jgi:alpha-tubulin suppressor-like RCC1 family protein
MIRWSTAAFFLTILATACADLLGADFDGYRLKPDATLSGGTSGGNLAAGSGGTDSSVVSAGTGAADASAADAHTGGANPDAATSDSQAADSQPDGAAGGSGMDSADGRAGSDGAIDDATDANGCPLGCPVSAPVCSSGACRAVTQIATGGAHTCALIGDGTVRCWGLNSAGQLGDGTTISRSIPRPAVVGLSNIAQIATGFYHSCAVTNAGSVWCWGSNPFGQIGLPPGDNQPIPVEVNNLGGPVAEVGCHGLSGYGIGYTCARMVSGRVRCWGSNSVGELGNGTLEPSSSPVEVVGLEDAKQIAVASDAVCAVRQTGRVVCWGGNGPGLLATGSSDPYVTAPEEVIGLSDVRMITGGNFFFCGVIGDLGRVTCWGGDGEGALGDGEPIGAPVMPPVDVDVGEVDEVRSGFRSSCARLRTGEVRCWGSNANGQHGTGTSGGYTAAPDTAALLSAPATSLDVRWTFGCALLQTGQVQCWGNNQNGNIGNGGVGGNVVTPALVRW